MLNFFGNGEKFFEQKLTNVILFPFLKFFLHINKENDICFIFVAIKCSANFTGSQSEGIVAADPGTFLCYQNFVNVRRQPKPLKAEVFVHFFQRQT